MNTPPVMKTIRLHTDAAGIATLTFDEPDSPVNTMCRAWQDDLVVAVDHLASLGDALRGVILASAKTSFFAGAQLALVMQHTRADAAA